MNLTGGIVSFIVVWWLIFFMALPFGAAPPEHPEPGHAPSAPDKPRLWTKALITTLLAICVTYGLAQLIEAGLVDVRPI